MVGPLAELRQGRLDVSMMPHVPRCVEAPQSGAPNDRPGAYDLAAMPESNGDDWITAPTAARLLGVQLHTVYRLIDSGELQCEQAITTVWKRNGRVGKRRSVRLRRRHVAEYIDHARVKPGQLRHLSKPATGEQYR